MSERYQAVHLAHAPGAKLSDVSAFSRTEAEAARAFHRSIPGYAPTPLADLPCLARELGVARVLVKDESFRFGLNAFKVLGGSWAIARALAARLGLDPKEMTYERLTSDETRTRIGEQTFVTATDGNHGRGVAWTAAKLKQRCIVYMPKGSSRERLENIRALGAEASITDVNYDGAVEMARETAERLGGTLVQDTSWPGYEDVPLWIMQGYTTLALEACEQLNGEIPTHVFLQAGVCSMAGAVAGFFASLWGNERRPAVTVVEPEAADCVFRTANAHDGTIHS
ncbi:MAG: diaminopropionate ammonia-lyase, partial [Pyramidobacter sp.]|nr:diaminopropionate ammonia-lyase [Pyramidobacter sp.]